MGNPTSIFQTSLRPFFLHFIPPLHNYAFFPHLTLSLLATLLSALWALHYFSATQLQKLSLSVSSIRVVSSPLTHYLTPLSPLLFATSLSCLHFLTFHIPSHINHPPPKFQALSPNTDHSPNPPTHAVVNLSFQPITASETSSSPRVSPFPL